MTAPLSFDVTVEEPVINVEVVEYEVGTILIEGPQGRQGDRGRDTALVSEIITGDGATTGFPLGRNPYANSSVQAFRNGLAEVPGVGFVVQASGGTTTILFSAAPLADDVVVVTYFI